jgi:protein gp37
MQELLNSELSFAAQASHIWWGVSVEDRHYGVPRIEDLRATNVTVRFLSIEPLLEDIGRLDLRDIHWVIVGGESGPGARPMKPEWVHRILAQCIKADVRFFFKQWGGRQKSRTGRTLNERTYDDMPEIQRNAFPREREERATLIEKVLSSELELCPA